MIAKRVIVEERILDTEVDKDKLINLWVDIMVDEIIGEIQAKKHT